MQNDCGRNRRVRTRPVRKVVALLTIALFITLFSSSAFARAVTNFTAEIINPCTVVLSWNRAEQYSGAFQLVYERIGNPYFNVLELDETSYTMDWLLPGREYRFWAGNENEDPEDSMYFDASRYITLTMPEAEKYTDGGFRIKSARLYRHEDNKEWLYSKDKREVKKGDSLADAADNSAYYTLVVNYDFDKPSSYTQVVRVLTAPDGAEYFIVDEIEGTLYKEKDGSQSMSFLFNGPIKDMFYYSDKGIQSGAYVFSVYIDGKSAVEKSVEW